MGIIWHTETNIKESEFMSNVNLDNQQDFLSIGLPIEAFNMLRNMQKGDNNNKKGHIYELMFGAYLILLKSSHISKENWKNLRLSNCEKAFVDDWNIIYDNQRENYQLRNSKNQAGKFNLELKNKFEWQTIIDEKINQCQSSNFLVCSNQNNNQYNSKYVKDNLIRNTKCQFFPYYPTWLELLNDESTQIREFLLNFCRDASQHETALRFIWSELSSSIYPKTLEELWNNVLQFAKPNIFSLSLIKLPIIFMQHCEKLGFELSGEYLTYRGLSFLITDKIKDEIKQEVIDLSEEELTIKFNSVKSLIEFLQKISSKNLQ